MKLARFIISAQLVNFDDIDLNLLRVFEVVMTERSVTRAAARLGRTQSAVSHSVNKLRYVFKDELMTRDGGTMRPTPRALELLSDLSSALFAIRAAIDRHQTFDAATTRRNFRIGLSDYHSTIFLPGLIREFAKRAPQATLNIVPVTGGEVGTLVVSRKLDCALLGAFEKEDPDLSRTQLGEDNLVCAVWSGSRLATSDLSLEIYLAATHVQISADGLAEGLADLALKNRGLRRTVVATISNYLAMPWVLRGTDHITHCGDSLVHMLNPASEIVFRQPPLPLAKVTVSLLVHRQLLTDPATVWLTQLIDEIFRSSERLKHSMLSANKFVR